MENKIIIKWRLYVGMLNVTFLSVAKHSDGREFILASSQLDGEEQGSKGGEEEAGRDLVMLIFRQTKQRLD